jgi:hypothetical protein
MEEGYALLQLHPKTTLRLWGKVGKRGGVALVPIECHSEELKRRGVSSFDLEKDREIAPKP